MIFLVVIKSEIINIRPTQFVINFNKMNNYIKVGKYLHLSAFIGIYLSFIGIMNIINIIDQHDIIIKILPWTLLIILGLSLTIIAELDVHGRYQNYKQVKEKLYKYGYNERIIKLYMHSNCQRDAVTVAAEDLKLQKKVKSFFFEKGYRWYHILLGAFFEDPLVIFKNNFWIKILFTEYYQLNFFYG